MIEEAMTRRYRMLEKNIWCYTGFIFEALLKMLKQRALFELVDVLIDSPFIDSLKDPDLLFRGSSNQRLIDAPASLEVGCIVLWERKSRMTP